MSSRVTGSHARKRDKRLDPRDKREARRLWREATLAGWDDRLRPKLALPPGFFKRLCEAFGGEPSTMLFPFA